MTQSSESTAGDLARLLFHGFIAVADADETLGPREVERLHQIASSPPASASRSLRAALESLREQYAELWKGYRAGTVGRSTESVASHWIVLRPRLEPAEAESFAREFLECLGEVVVAGSPVLARLGLRSNAKAKALEDLRRRLDGGAFAADAQGLPPAGAPASVPTVASAQPAADLPGLWPSAGLVVGSAPAWARGKTRVRCVNVVPETHDVKSFHFVASPGCLFSYRPGQFVTLELPLDGRTVRRSYTISSSPSRPYTLSITVKRVQGGLVSNWLHENMAPGFEFNLSGPNGDFTCFGAPAEKLLLVSGGSGVTPVMSMLRWLADTESPCDVVFLNCVHSPADVIFAEEFRVISARMGARLRLGVVPSHVEPGHSWVGPTGRVSEALVRLYAPDFAEREVFVCGPGGFMYAVRGLLAGAGHPAERYHEESFGGAPAGTPAPARPARAAGVAAAAAPRPAASPAPPAPAATPAAAGGEIVFAKSGKTVKCGPDDAILDVAEANGIAMENSCRSGTCGSCKTKKVEGTVHLDDQRALSDEDIAAGYVLVCVGRAEGRVVIEA